MTLNENALTENALVVIRQRYLMKDKDGEFIETPDQMFRRVAKAIASANGDEKYEDSFYRIMSNLEFLPNSPALFNAGTKRLGLLSACFVLPIEDNIISIMDGVKNAVLIHQSGGGTGYTFSHLRPKDDIVASTGGIASGPISFMKIYDVATEVIKQGGKRRGANMGILSVSHPDIINWLVMKEREGAFNNFSVSVSLTDEFMEAVKNDEEYPLINPRNNKIVKMVSARAIWNLLIAMSWHNGEPGVIFIDTINKYNSLIKIGKMEATNPCSEVPLYPYESCNLGSINLSKMIKNNEIDWEKLKEIIWLAVRFLDDIIDVNIFPLPQIEVATKLNRKIGLGVMGFADMLIKMDIPYNSLEARKLGQKIMKFITEEARQCSVELGKERGSFANFKLSKWSENYDAMRNATVTAIAPTGSISIIAGCSSGIEPIFSFALKRNLKESLGENLVEIHPLLVNSLLKHNISIEDFGKKGYDIDLLPDEIKRIFVTALDLTAEDHVRMQAAFQKYVDNGVSKTINFPESATICDIEKAFWLAYQLECKGLTVYRNNSRKKQILESVKNEELENEKTCRNGSCSL